MQKRLSFIAMALFFSALWLSSCKNDNNNSNNSNLSPGNWKVVYFFDDKDETSDFTGYVFDFGSNGSLSASRNGQSWNGTWATGIDDSTNKLDIDFSGVIPDELEEIEEDWRILKMNDDVMQLEHTSGGNGDTDVLHFQRI